MARFIGRSSDLKKIAEWIKTYSLVTIVGPGGIGKTRLVNEFLSDHSGTFVDLASAPDRAAVEDLIAGIVGGGVRWIESLRKTPMLLVLDNAEHVLDVVVDVAERVAETNTTLIITSREPLQLDHEKVLNLSPLSVDETEGAASRNI